MKKIEISKNVQKEPWFLEINPNGRIPALTDVLDGKQINLFESGSIMQYLVSRYDPEYKISYPAGTREFYEMNNWLFFQNAVSSSSFSSSCTEYVSHRSQWLTGSRVSVLCKVNLFLCCTTLHASSKHSEQAKQITSPGMLRRPSSTA